MEVDRRGRGRAPAQKISNLASITPKRSSVAIRKFELYSSLWQSCDALRGGLYASPCSSATAIGVGVG
jgi:hypothetical protein